MAKRRGGIDPMAFMQGGGSDDGGMKDLATLMGLLGLGEGQGKEERQSREQQALQAYYEGQIAQQQAKGGREQEQLGMTKAEAEANAKERLAAEAARQETRKYQQEAALRDVKAKESEEEYKNFAQIMASPDYTPAEKRRIASKRSPAAAAVEAEMKQERGEKFTGGLEEAYEGFAKDPKSIAMFLKSQEKVPGYEEMLKSADWQRLNQGMPAPEPGLVSRLLGVLGSGAGARTQTAPPVEQSGQGRRGYGAVPGGEPAGKPLTEILGLQDPLRYIRQQATPSIEATAEKPFSYEEGYPSAQPNYMSGIQTPLPMDVINRIEGDPRYMSAEQELLKSAMDWWNKGAPAPPGGPSAMPPRILPLGQMAPF